MYNSDMDADDEAAMFNMEVYAARIIQNAFRARKLQQITEFVREKITCVVCGDPGDSFLCRNGHPICRTCLYMRCATRHHECCVCRDDKGFHPSPFLKQADLMGLSWKCPDCHCSVPVICAASHRNTCSEREVTCPIDGCGKNMPRSALMEHILQHPDRSYTLVTASRVGVIHHGGNGEILLAWPERDRVIHVQLTAQHDLSACTTSVWYSVQLHTFGDDFSVHLENIDPLDGTVREVCYVDVVGSGNNTALSPVHARLQAIGYRTETSIMATLERNGTTSGLPLVDGISAYRQLRQKMILPPVGSLCRLSSMTTVYDAISPRASGMLCFTLGLDDE